MEDILELILPFIPFLIPLAGIGLLAFSQWLKFKAKQAELGASTDELVKEVQALKASISQKDEAIQKRIRNLETIVTSQDWDTINMDNLNVSSGSNLLDDMMPPATDDNSDAQRAEQIARRLKN